MAVRPTNASTPHLRNACDACTIAKVKCSQGRPQCKRCGYRGILCQYSVSLRATKKPRRPNSVSSSVLRGSDSTAASRECDGQETLDAMMDSSSVTSANRIFSDAYNLITPSFDDDSVLSSFFEDWDPDTGDNNAQTYVPESNVDTMPFFPNFINLPQGGSSPNPPQPTKASQQGFNSHSNSDNTHSSNFLAKTTSSFFPSRTSTAGPPPTPPPSTAAPTPTASAPNATSIPHACQCQQLILSKLGDMSHRKTDPTIPFDQCLSENRSAIALCNATVNCSNTHHDDDLVLMLTHLALLAHVILFYDRPWEPQQHRKALDPFSSEDGPKSKFHHSHDLQQHQPPPQQQQQSTRRVRLSLGTYELDTRDEAILQNNLLRIELCKIKTLMEAFERRFRTLEWMSGGFLGTHAAASTTPTTNGIMGGEYGGAGGGGGMRSNGGGDGEEEEGKPLGELIGWLKRRLRGNYEALAHWGRVEM